jgi:hypothetical protein
MHGPINVKSPNNISKWQMGFNSALEELRGSYLAADIFLLFFTSILRKIWNIIQDSFNKIQFREKLYLIRTLLYLKFN